MDKTKVSRIPKLCCDLDLKYSDEMLNDLEVFSSKSDAINRSIQAIRSKCFLHPDGREEDLREVGINIEEAALLSYLCRQCKLKLSVEIGFGVGTSASIMLGVRSLYGQPFEHIVFDPYGLPDNRGKLVQSYLEAEFGDVFHLVRKPSEIGLGQLLEERKRGCAGLIFIDGGHHFENVMTDFVLADKLCCDGGYIVFDDALFPAIETVINYISANRSDYALAHLPVENASVIQKNGSDKRNWMTFKPFHVPDRIDWDPSSKY